MIKAILKDHDNRTVVLLGISETNINLMHQDKPLHVDMREMLATKDLDVKLKDVRIVVIAGKTEETILNSLRTLLGPEVVFIDETIPAN